MKPHYNFRKMRPPFVLWLTLMVVALSLFLVRTYNGESSGVEAAAQIQPIGKGVAPLDCGDEWSIVPSPDVGDYGDNLYDVEAIASNDVWAVGEYDTLVTARTEIEHWDGNAWSIITSPNLGAYYNTLGGVDSAASNDVWAVGYYINTFDLPSKTVVIHWDGSAWSVVPSPNIDNINSSLQDVVVVSSNDIWAVGTSGDGKSNPVQTLVEHWDGNIWSIVPHPTPINLYGGFNSIAAVSANDMWAVGAGNLIEHWDGSEWSISNTSGLSTTGVLESIDVVAANDIWAVGRGPVNTTIIEHWDGSEWSVVSSPSPGDLSGLLAVTAISTDDVYAAGHYFSGASIKDTLIEHWDGNAWSIVPSANLSPYDDMLWAMDALSSTDVWAVGVTHLDGSFQTLTERYNPVPCTPTPTKTATETATETATAEATKTELVASPTAEVSASPTPEMPPCPGELFTDVCPSDYFYTATLALANDSIISGYNTVPPCENEAWIPCFNPYSFSTRGQISKVIALASNFSDPVNTQTFEDVLPDSTFYEAIERMAMRGILVGYPCGGIETPCLAPANKPYFLPNNTVTRGQLAKMTALTFGWNDEPDDQPFEDMLAGSTFYTYTAQLYIRTIIGGYPCGSPEPCVPPDNLPYYRPGSNVTRGQTAKIVQLARTQPTPSPTETVTPGATETPESTVTQEPTMEFTATPTEVATVTPTDTIVAR